MKNQKRRSVFLLFLCMALLCIPIQVSAGSTTLTATVPEQPTDTMEAPKGAEILGEVPLPAGWVWEKPDTELVPGIDLTATALYKEENGKVLAERTIVIYVPKTPEATSTPKPTVTPEATATPTPEPTVTPRPEVTITPEATITLEPTKTPDRKPSITPKEEAKTSSGAVKTGDETNIGLWIAAAVLAAGVLAIAGIRLMRKRK